MATFSVSNSNGRFTLTLTVSETSYNVANNTSDLAWSLDLKANTSWHFSNYGIGRWVTINGTSVLSMSKSVSPGMTLNGYSSINLGSGTLNNVAHNSDGTKTVSISFSIEVTSAEHTPGNLSGYGSLTLTTIPRKSSVSALDANIESSTLITINRASSSFTHTLTYKFGSLTGTIATKTANTSIGWTIPTSFYAQIPNSKTGVCTITCETFNGSTSLGTNTCNITITASESKCKPTISGTVVDTNSTTIALTGSNAKLIKFFSTAQCTLTSSTKNSATVSVQTINGVNGATRTITNVEVSEFNFYVKDSRGYENSVKITPTMINYVKLTNNANAVRVTPTGNTVTLTLAGNYFNGSFGSKSNSLTCKYRYKESGGSFSAYTTVTATKSGNTYSYSTTVSGFAYNKSYILEVVVNDELMSVTKTIDVSQGVPVFDWSKNDFAFHVPVTMDSPLGVEYGGTGATTVAGIHTNLGEVDYVVEQGTSGIWTYRKWNSGVLECHGAFLKTVTINTLYAGSVYYAVISDIPNFPVTFTSITCATVSVVSSYGLPTAHINGLNYSHVDVTVHHPGSANLTLSCNIDIKGTWK